ncbi:MAG TPA: cytochrome c-type biogenesis protein CcmH [Iamia sp.]|nr:cytochrome c-type biogenesis protein CcmH [Iamia sp.]
MTRRTLWIVLGLVAVVALALGSRSGGARTDEQRLWSIAGGVRCPTCAGQSVATSDAPAAESIREQIREDIDAGRSDDDIRARLADGAFGEDILLNPPRSGFAALVWVIPVVVVVVAFGGLALAFRRWERIGPSGPSRQDRDLVAAALGSDPDDTHGEGSGR